MLALWHKGLKPVHAAADDEAVATRIDGDDDRIPHGVAVVHPLVGILVAHTLHAV